MAESLSGDALQLVFSYLGRLAELHQCRCVCKLWRTAAEAIGPRLDFFYERPLLRFYSETMRQLIEQELRNLATLHEAERHGLFGYLLNESRPNQYSTIGEALLGSLCTAIRRQSPHHMMLQGLLIPNVTGGFEPSSRWTIELEGFMCLEQASAPDFWHYRNIQLHTLRESERRPALLVVYRVHDLAGFVVVTDFLRDHCPVGQGRVVSWGLVHLAETATIESSQICTLLIGHLAFRGPWTSPHDHDTTLTNWTVVSEKVCDHNKACSIMDSIDDK
jgi:hypothetical protein